MNAPTTHKPIARRLHSSMVVDAYLLRNAIAQHEFVRNPETDLFFYHSELSCKPRAEGTCSLCRGAAESLVQSTNHLGSASWITDASGTPIQHIQYCPYGNSPLREIHRISLTLSDVHWTSFTFVDQHTGSYMERFTFTGKERDEETGYHYFGARYLDANLMTGWLSRTYEESSELQGYVLTLQKFDEVIRQGEADGSIVVSENVIDTNQNFEI